MIWYNEDRPIKDSGHRREFETGAQRDRATGKGLPMLISPVFMEDYMSVDGTKNKLDGEYVIGYAERMLWTYANSKDKLYLIRAASGLEEEFNYIYPSQDLFLRLAKHLEKGAEKYEARNWEKGMPIEEYLNSAFRHLWSVQNGHEDEDHWAACLFNIMAAYHTHVLWEREVYPDGLGPHWPDNFQKNDENDKRCNFTEGE